MLSSTGALQAGARTAGAKNALIDWLSLLPNRRALIERLNAMGECGKNEMQSVVFIDLDGFKDVNDNYGHDTGDADCPYRPRITRSGSAGAMLARMGGDEFAMTMSGEHAVNQASASPAVLELLKLRCAQRPENIYQRQYWYCQRGADAVFQY